MAIEYEESTFLDELFEEIEAETSISPVGDIFKPKTFEEFVGQNDVKKLLILAIDAAKLENRPLPNLLIVGGFGLGKSVLAEITVDAAGKKARVTDGATVNKSLPSSGTVVIDEIHNLDDEACDRLNLLMDKGTIHIIGCTTDPGKLPAAFRSRFRLLTLTNYTEDDLAEIAKRVCSRKGVTATEAVLNFVAQRSRFNARQIINYLSIIFDLMAVKKSRAVTMEVVREAFDLLGVDDEGYLKRDKDYVSRMPSRPVGLGWLSSVLGIDKATIENEIEPYLLQTGVIDRTPKGRVKLKEISVERGTNAEASARLPHWEDYWQGLP